MLKFLVEPSIKNEMSLEQQAGFCGVSFLPIDNICMLLHIRIALKCMVERRQTCSSSMQTFLAHIQGETQSILLIVPQPYGKSPRSNAEL